MPRSRAAVSTSASGSVRVLATAVMKLASPVQRGTTWTCRCSLTEPPAGWPRLMPTLIPSGEYARLIARTASVTVLHSSAVSSAVEILELGDLAVRQHEHVPGAVREAR